MLVVPITHRRDFRTIADSSPPGDGVDSFEKARERGSAPLFIGNGRGKRVYRSLTQNTSCYKKPARRVCVKQM